ncbi:hypothetical protein BDY19DRAFT_941646 [Irpex rosettiformis]|uniref:Uncharacterized protein n=1 Tax=Irpex rosettiformis TaxID=378272 RepID=A0ACB8U7M4_9APHY|nr:hypothetical protein BDY19DRAFT_941646 [Irpex rosettiformis]
MVHKLMFYGLGIGCLTIITSMVTLILIVTSKSPLTYGGMGVIMSKAYANSLLAMLNIRQGLRNGAASDDVYSVELSDVSPPNPASLVPEVKLEAPNHSQSDSNA